MQATLRNRINSYALAAGCFLYVNNKVIAQVTYVNVDPDIILDEAGQVSEMDLDYNGTIDFWFHNNSFPFYSDLFSSTQTIQDILVGPDVLGNSIAGNSVYISAPYGGYIRFYAYALAQNSMIDSELQWHDNNLDIMALRTFYHSGDDTLFCLQCYWYSYYTPQTIDHYVAIKFKGIDFQYHFGWIRCDVLDEGRTLVIKDFAYEQRADFPLKAGDTTEYVSIIPEENAFYQNTYSFGDILHINFSTEFRGYLTVFAIDGKEVFRDEIQAGNYLKALTLPDGIYLVNLRTGNSSFSKKIFIR